MLEPYKILIIFAVLLSFAKSPNSFHSDKINFTPGQIKTYSNGVENKNSEVEIEFRTKEEKVLVGTKVVLLFTTNFSDTSIFNPSTIEKDSFFITEVRRESDIINASCRLWILSDNKISLFCNLNEKKFYKRFYNITISNQSFKYNNLLIKIIFLQDIIQIDQRYLSIPFLYSHKQIININDDDSYELKFKIEIYEKELLYICGSNNNYGVLDNCQVNENELICTITKEKIEEFLVEKNEHFKIGAMHEDFGLIPFDHVLDITINYENVQRQNIYLEIKEIIGSNTEMNVPVGLVTNVTDLPNFISAKFEEMKYFKKMTNRPLTLFYNFSFEIDYIMKSNYTEEVVISDIHYKYNFRIQPSEFEGHITVKEEGTNIFLTYPQELIYDSEEKTLQIIYIANNPDKLGWMALNYDNWGLDCRDENKMKICLVSKSHFDGKQSGYYYTRYTGSRRYPYWIYYDSPLIKVSKPLEINIIKDNYDIYTGYNGYNGYLYFKTDYNDTILNVFNDSKIEKDIRIHLYIRYNYGLLSPYCHLWKNTSNITYIFCEYKSIREPIKSSRYKINIDKEIFTYNNIVINIQQKDDLYMVILERPIPFLYSKTQTINLEEGKNTYHLKFSAENYQNENLIIRREYVGFVILDKCSMEKKELICPIDKSELEELYFDHVDFNIYYSYSFGPLIPIGTIDKVIINNKPPKIDLKITIKKLLESHININDSIVYEVETDVTNVTNLVTGTFILDFKYNDRIIIKFCYFKKIEQTPMYLLCESKLSINLSMSLSEIKEIMPLNDIHEKYNFYIQPVKSDDIINIAGSGSRLGLIIPKTLDFYTNETIYIELSLSNVNYTKGIRFNLNASEDLDCEDLESIKRCLVPKSHFEKKNGYHNIYHLNYMNKYIRFYECSPIQVIFPDDDEIIIKILDNNNETQNIGQKGFVSFDTDFIDNEQIFDITNIEKETSNKMTFSGIYKDYQANCRLWKLKSAELKLICNFEENIDTQKIKLNKFSFTYKGKKFILYCQNVLYINQLNSSVSFLYSDKQEINMDDNTPEYNLIFKKELYNNEVLILYKNDNDNMRNVYLNCVEETKEVKCSVSKDKLIGILSKSGEVFNLSQLTESEGILDFKNVKDIIINYPKVIKKDIYLNVTKLLTPEVKINNYIAFETNITDIQIITTGIFKIPKHNYYVKEWNCLFKKSNNQQDDKLFLFCDADYEGKYYFGINEQTLDNINILYNFKIPKINIREKINVLYKIGSRILSVYPYSLNFESQKDLIIK